tara:strand:- start:147 stop:998 length:852 start_codon:yes stop_codon:yes gene_type:complete
MNKFTTVDLNEDQIKNLKSLEEYTKSFFSNNEIFNESNIINVKEFPQERKHVDGGMFKKSLTYSVGVVEMYETITKNNNSIYSNFYQVTEDDVDLSIFQNFVGSFHDTIKNHGNELNLDEENVGITLQLCEYPLAPNTMVTNLDVENAAFSFTVSTDCKIYFEPHDEFMLSNSGLLVTGNHPYFMLNYRDKTLYVFSIFIIHDEEVDIEPEPEPEKRNVKLEYRPPWGRPKENEELTDPAQQTSKTKMNKVKMVPDVERVGRKDSQWGVDKYTVRPKRKDDKT